MSPGARFRAAVADERPLQLPGVINAYAALLARDAGFRAVYLSGAGVANASYGLPDLGVTTLANVCEDVRRITAVCERPLLVDADTGWGGDSGDSKARSGDSSGGVAHSIAELERAGAAACHVEDQIEAKRCGHRPNKRLVPTQEMCDRIRAGCDGRANDEFVIMARTDAVAPEGLDAAITRCHAYIEAGADMIFSEALQSLADYRTFTEALEVPVLANITEFGKTPLFTVDELRDAGIAIALYPLSAFRAMSQAALEVYQTLRRDGTQAACIERMQTRAELYKHLDYHSFETRLDETIGQAEEPS